MYSFHHLQHASKQPKIFICIGYIAILRKNTRMRGSVGQFSSTYARWGGSGATQRVAFSRELSYSTTDKVPGRLTSIQHHGTKTATSLEILEW